MQVNEHVLVQRKAVLVGLQNPDTGAVEAPQRGTQVTRGSDVVSDWPQTASDVATLDPAPVQGHEDKQTLAALRDIHPTSAVRDKRAAEQMHDGCCVPQFAANEHMHNVRKHGAHPHTRSRKGSDRARHRTVTYLCRAASLNRSAFLRSGY